MIEPAGEDPGAGGQQAEGALDVVACERLLQAGAEAPFGAPRGDLALELGGVREAVGVVAGSQVTGQPLPPLGAPSHFLYAAPAVLDLPDSVEQTQQPAPLAAGEGGEPARLGQGDIAAHHGDRQAQHIGDGAVGAREVQAGEGGGENGEVLLDGDARCLVGDEVGAVITQCLQV
ncbi:hypothetical protein BKH05_03060 [Actinomyces naeslundii]|nr:hypothetical protein BKH05_03060 [Actinomyces naeslundii]